MDPVPTQVYVASTCTSDDIKMIKTPEPRKLSFLRPILPDLVTVKAYSV
jgi:hypothetical protein